MAAGPRSAERAHAILNAARTRLGERGYLATTVAEIAAEAGVNRGLLHNHKSKEELLAQVVRASSQASLELVEAMFDEAKRQTNWRRG